MKMISFKEFVKANDMDEEKKDIEKTLKKLPHSHASLVKGYKWKFHSGNTLNGDNQHVGYIDDSDKEIAVASPWNYGREFTILHEVGHKVWENFVTPQMKNQWNKIVANTKNKQEQEKTTPHRPPPPPLPPALLPRHRAATTATPRRHASILRRVNHA